MVLSACETALGQTLSGGEVASLSEAFIAAGSRAVVASLWPIDDHNTRSFMRAFYGARSKGNATGLVNAQREMIKAGSSPAIWAAFTLTGW